MDLQLTARLGLLRRRGEGSDASGVHGLLAQGEPNDVGSSTRIPPLNVSMGLVGEPMNYRPVRNDVTAERHEIRAFDGADEEVHHGGATDRV